MAWRPTERLLEGELDNTIPGKITGWMLFAGMSTKVVFDLDGDFHRDIRGAKIHLVGDGNAVDPAAADYMDGFSAIQAGKAGDITAGLPPKDYVAYPYIEWYSDDNGRVVLELRPDQLKMIGNPAPPDTSSPISRAEQAKNMTEFLNKLGKTMEDNQ